MFYRLFIRLVAVGFIYTISCNTKEQQQLPWRSMVIGGYVFDLPSDFRLKEEGSTDSYTGRIEGDSIRFFFDYGDYSSIISQTEAEYLEAKEYLHEASLLLRPKINHPADSPFTIKVIATRKVKEQDVLTCDGCDYIALLQYGDSSFQWPVYIPARIKKHDILIDSFDNTYRRLVIAKDPQDGFTGIYLRQMGKEGRTGRNYPALSITADIRNKDMQQLALRIYKSGRRRKPN
jgi:hypothetical protein